MFLAAGDLPSVGGDISSDLPSASVDASGSLPAGEVDVSVPSVSGGVEGAKAAGAELSADVGAKMDDVAVKVPDMPSGEVKKPKKGRFGGLPAFKMTSSKKVEVSLARAIYAFVCLVGWSFGRASVCRGVEREHVFVAAVDVGFLPCVAHIKKRGQHSLTGTW